MSCLAPAERIKIDKKRNEGDNFPNPLRVDVGSLYDPREVMRVRILRLFRDAQRKGEIMQCK